MKIKVSFDASDLLEEIEVYDKEDDSFDTYYNYKNVDEIKRELRDEIIDYIGCKIINDVEYDREQIKSIRDEIIARYKDELIEQIVKEVSKSIIHTKVIKDFKKTLE